MTGSTFCGIIYLPVTPELLSKGGEIVEITLAFLISVTAGLFVELICRWLDGNSNR